MSTGQRVVPVSAGDKVSDVLARDDRLVEVFVRHASHFAKLRDRMARRVMARLITVEQAARTANIPVEQLVRDLNLALGLAPDQPDTSTKKPIATFRAQASRRPTTAPIVELDVREDLRSGREPFSRIMSAVSDLHEGDVLHLRATFEPVPLFAVLGKRGFLVESSANAPDDWSVWFWRPGPAAPLEVTPTQTKTASDPLPADDDHTTYLDVRGFSPPEPMTRTLAALDSLEPGHTLVQVNERVPQFLLPVLVERGFAYEIDESRSDRVLVRISHA